MFNFELLPLAVLVLSFWHDPRKFRTGLYLLVALIWAILSLVGVFNSVALAWDDAAAGWLLLALIAIGGAAVLWFAFFLIATGITLVRKEGFGLSRLLSIGVGTVLLAYLGLVVAAVVIGLSSGSLLLFWWVFLLGFPAGYLGLAFMSFLIYGSVYPALMARFGRPVVAVVVLGSGLIAGRVPPLLASRLRRGRALFDGQVAQGRQVLIVTSGGQGPDEPVAEGVAMAEFLTQEGVAPEQVLIEDRSRTTAENMAYTAALLAERGISGPIAAVTSDFHAFRAALLMRKQGIDGYAVGAPTARYYWPSAVIREFIAVLRDHLWLNVIGLTLSLVPLLVALVVR